jgi:hypothetical protein
MDTPKTFEQWRDAVIDERIANIMRIKNGPEHKNPMLDGITRALAALGGVQEWMVPAVLRAAVEQWEKSEYDYAVEFDAYVAGFSDEANFPPRCKPTVPPLDEY